MSELAVPVPVFNAVRNLILYYLRRRRETAIRAMVELRPDIIKSLYLEKALGVTIPDEVLEAFSRQEREGTFQQEGIWNEVWRYWLHRDTCELVHLRTGERFDWKAGHPKVFFTGELFFHLKWRMKRHADNLDLQVYKAWQDEAQTDLDALLAHLAEHNALIRRGQHEWAVPPDQEL